MIIAGFYVVRWLLVIACNSDLSFPHIFPLIVFARFTDDNARRMSVVQYFRERYNIALQFTSLPALVAGSEARPIYLPMEVL